MNRYLITYEERNRVTILVEAESEAAARAAWIDGTKEEDNVEFENLESEIISIEETL